MHATNIIKHESQGNFQGKGFKHIQRQNPQKYKVLNVFFTRSLNNASLLVFNSMDRCLRKRQ